MFSFLLPLLLLSDFASLTGSAMHSGRLLHFEEVHVLSSPDTESVETWNVPFYLLFIYFKISWSTIYQDKRKYLASINSSGIYKAKQKMPSKSSAQMTRNIIMSITTALCCWQTLKKLSKRATLNFIEWHTSYNNLSKTFLIGTRHVSGLVEKPQFFEKNLLSDLVAKTSGDRTQATLARAFATEPFGKSL